MTCFNNYNDIKHLIDTNSIIFDIGSNIGNFSKRITDSKNYKTIYLFEPVTLYLEMSKILLQNENCYFINKGVSNKNEQLTLYKSDIDKNIGWNTFLTEDPNQPNEFYNKMDSEIKDVITLDSFCEENNIQNIDLIKIDVEGFECKVLEGFLKTLTNMKKKPHIYIEVGWGTNHPEWDYCKKIYNKIFEIGYNCVNFSDKTEDILFIPL
jgi:FkbM family methyltransferase